MKVLKTAVLACAVALGVYAHEELKGKAVAFKGMVVDTGCYFAHEGMEKGHAACAAMCAKNGIPLAVVDESGKLYMVVANDHKNPNTRLMPFVEKKVKVTGTLVEKGGMSGLAIKTIEAAE
jgi:hypothetical protein